jgi:dipeptidyl aminopeptidase/acylaminoacyl peptidase
MRSWIRALFVLISVVNLSTTGVAADGRPAEYYFPQDHILRVRISPDGEWVVATASNGEASGLLAQRFGNAAVEPNHTSRRGSQSIDWIGRDTLLARFGVGDSRRFLIVEFLRRSDGGFTRELQWFQIPGHLVDPLPLVDDKVVWEFDVGGTNSVHHLSIDDLVHYRSNAKVRKKSIRIGETVASIKGSSDRWIVDENGYPLVAWRRDESSYATLYRPNVDERFEEITNYAFESPDYIKPFGLSRNGQNLVVTAYNKQDTIGLFEFDPRTKEIVREIYRREDADITWVTTDPITRDVLYVVYEVDGERRRHYLESSKAWFADHLGPDNPSIDVIDIVSSTADRKRFVYWETGVAEPGVHHLRSASTDETILVGQRGVEIDRATLAKAESFLVSSEDGTPVEAYLIRPHAPIAEAAPLIVFPHGGPIGVRDRLEFDPFVQYLASWGFAILQVNYRGSSGYGRKFKAAGRGQWAKGIEDDIDAAVEHAMTLPNIDGDRVCIIGGSYGGFSAIASIVRHKSRYRCATTINGVSDIPLLAETSDIADSKRALDAFQENTGDLKTERDKLLAVSPAYHLQNVETPILVVYGDADRRVDPDHAHRMVIMLRLYGKEYEEIRVKDGPHSFSRKQWIWTLPAIREFLTKHLMPDLKFRPDPRKPDDTQPVGLPDVEIKI